MTGSLLNTSARYILIMPELTLSHVLTCGVQRYMVGGVDEMGRGLTAEMSSSMGECHRSEAVLIWEVGYIWRMNV